MISKEIINLAGQIIGFVGIAVNFMIYQQQTQKKILRMKLISDIMWLLSYLFLFAISGACVAGIALIRELVFIRQSEKEERSNLWLVLLIALSLAVGISTWHSVWSIMLALASCISAIGFWNKKPMFTRILAIPVSLCMLSYDIFFAVSYPGIVNEILTLTSIFLGIIRNKKEEKT